MAFTFQPYTSPLTGSIAQTLQQAGAIEAQRAYTAGNAAANAALQRGNAWSGAIQGIGQTIGALPGQIAAVNRSNTVDAMNKITLADAQRGQAGAQAVAGMLQGDQLPAGQEGPRRPTYLDEQGLYDIPKLTAALGAQGFGDRAADLVKGAETINESITTHQKTQAQLAKDQAILTGDMAHGTLALMNSGMPIDQAMDVASSAAVMSGSIAPAQYAKVRTQILGLPPEQQQAALEGIRNEAAKLAPTKVLAEGATETDRYGRSVAKGGEKPQDFTLGEGQIRYDKSGTPVAWGPDKPAPPPRPIEEQLLEAIANGDTTKATQIKQTLQTAAEARRDPAAAAMAHELGGLRADEARARLEALKAKNAPVDITPDVQTTTAGRSYVDLSTYTGDARNRARDAANAAGAVPVSKEQAGALQQIDNARANQRDIHNQIKDLLPTTPGGRGAAAVAVPLQKLFQSQDQVAAFNSWRTAAIQTLRATAGSQGLRINEAEIAQAVANDIPQLTDTVGTAQQKLKNIDTMLENAERSILVRDRSPAAAPPAATLTAGQTQRVIQNGVTYDVTTDAQGHMISSRVVR